MDRGGHEIRMVSLTSGREAAYILPVQQPLVVPSAHGHDEASWPELGGSYSRKLRVGTGTVPLNEVLSDQSDVPQRDHSWSMPIQYAH